MSARRQAPSSAACAAAAAVTQANNASREFGGLAALVPIPRGEARLSADGSGFVFARPRSLRALKFAVAAVWPTHVSLVEITLNASEAMPAAAAAASVVADGTKPTAASSASGSHDLVHARELARQQIKGAIVGVRYERACGHVVVCSWCGAGTVHVFSSRLSNSKVIQTWRAGRCIVDAAASPCGGYLAVAHDNGSVDVYTDWQAGVPGEARRCACVRALSCSAPLVWPTAVQWLPEGLVLTTDKGEVYIWGFEVDPLGGLVFSTRPLEMSNAHSASITAVHAHAGAVKKHGKPAASVLVTGDSSGVVKVWHLRCPRSPWRSNSNSNSNGEHASLASAEPLAGHLLLVGAVSVPGAVSSCTLSEQDGALLVGTRAGGVHAFDRWLFAAQS